MGCNCGSKKKKFKAVTQKGVTPPAPLDILTTPDEKLTPRQIRVKHRHFRIQARTARIARRIAMAERLRQSANASSNITT